MNSWNAPRIREILLKICEYCPASYLVGGAVRDFLISGAAVNDLDVAVDTDGYQLAKKVADRLGRDFAFVPLDQEHGTGRVVVRGERQAEVDISSFRAATLEQDLGLRDFTINALSVRVCDVLDSDAFPVIDPTGGLADLQTRTIRACSEVSFSKDPVRILRAFRFAACLGFTISEATLGMIPSNLARLQSIAWERIRDELVALLTADSAYPALTEMDEAGVVDDLFPELIPMKGCGQNDFHHLDVWRHSLEVVRQMESLLASDAAAFGEVAKEVVAYVREELVPSRPRRALLKLAAIFHDSGKPAARFIDSRDRVRFFGHERMSRVIFEGAAKRLKLAKREISFVSEIIAGHMRPTMFTSSRVSARAINRLYRHFGTDVTGLLILFLADLASSRGPARRPSEWEHARERVVSALGALYQALEQRRERLVTGRDLMNSFHLEQGPRVGTLLRRIEELQDLGKISTKEDALEAARTMLAALQYGRPPGTN
jgi:tRNA nucleotidyltransferase/poly(A) polymerase